MAFQIKGDILGPWKILFIHNERIGLEAYLVIDNVACGPSIGGVRMTEDVTIQEIARLARAMTLKNAAAGLPHGGGKAGILADPKMPQKKKEDLLRSFARAIRELTDYIPGPDMGTDETCMAWIRDEIGRAVGLPKVLGGIPLDTVGATGYGLAISAEVCHDLLRTPLKGARVAIQGFGAVGTHAARFLQQRGAILVAVADSHGAIESTKGLPVDALIALKNQKHSIVDFKNGSTSRIDLGQFASVDCDILIPAAGPDFINGKNARSVKAKLILQGANLPVTSEAEKILFQRKIVSIPDFIANAGGVICAAVEFRGGSQAQAFDMIGEKIRENTKAVIELSRKTGTMYRQAAEDLATRRVLEAEAYRLP